MKQYIIPSYQNNFPKAQYSLDVKNTKLNKFVRRKNLNHKNNYSHPADSDYDEIDDREECPYGKKCYRKNPQHKMQFKHTSVPRHRRRAATPMHSVTNTTSETDHSSAEESVDESDYEPSVYTGSSDDLDESTSEWEDGTTG